MGVPVADGHPSRLPFARSGRLGRHICRCEGTPPSDLPFPVCSRAVDEHRPTATAPRSVRHHAAPAVPGARSLASVTPFGWHLPGVHPWRSLWSTMVDNLDNLPAAWSVLAHGVCDRSSLGVAGLNDGLPGGFHIDEPRRRHLRHHTQPAIAPADLLDLPRLRRMGPDALANLGRLGAPFIHRTGERGFTKVSWEDALRAIDAAIPKPKGKRMAFLAGEESLSIEAAYAFSKTARLLTSPHVDLLPPQPPSSVGDSLQAALGTAQATASAEDILDAQVVLVIGTSWRPPSPAPAPCCWLPRGAAPASS